MRQSDGTKKTQRLPLRIRIARPFTLHSVHLAPGWTDLATAFEVSVSQKKAQNLLPILKSLKKTLVNYTHSFAVPDVPYSSLSGYISPEKKGAAYPTYPNLWGDLTAAHLILIVWRLGVAHFLPGEKSPYFGPFRVEESPKKWTRYE